ncbi:MAG: hypothetical protein GY810_11110 [Aureispira sp.]|nr:hypothetical protein [Aureispira sp.]
MAKKNKASKQYEEEEEHGEKLSINSEDREFGNDVMSVNGTGGSNEKTSVNNGLEEKKPVAEDAIPADFLMEEESPTEVLEEQPKFIEEEKEEVTPAEVLMEEDPTKEEEVATELDEDIKEEEIVPTVEVLKDKESLKKEKDATESDEDIKKEEEEEEEETMGGLSIPEAKAKRDPKMDIDPLEGEDLGLDEDDFLADREVNPLDLKAHMKLKKKDLLGSNVRRPRDFASIFDKGKSSKEDPKLDLGYSIHHNTPFKKELIAQQLLRNYHSTESREVANTERIFKEFQLDEETLEEIKTDTLAHENEELIEKLKNIIPSNL